MLCNAKCPDKSTAVTYRCVLHCRHVQFQGLRQTHILKDTYISRLYVKKKKSTRVGIACWYEHRTRDRKVASSNPGRSGGRIFFSSVNFVCRFLFGVFSTPRVTAVARKRPRSFFQKCRWQVTPKHAYTLDPMKSEWADCAAVRA